MKQLLLSILMLLPLAASAEVVEKDGLWYNLNSEDNTAEVVASQDGMYKGDITIPNYLYLNKSYRVTSIGESAFEGCTDLTSITLPTTLRSIEKGAFYGCSGLTSVRIPDGVTKIGLGAFSVCYNMECVIIPKSVTTIESYAFDHCPNLNCIVSEGENPIAIDNTVFESFEESYSVYAMATLVVPNGSKSAYHATMGWSFSTIYEASEQKSRTIHVAIAGTLPNYISDMEKYQIEELTLTGELNGKDIRFIRQMSGADFKSNGTSEERYSDISTSGILKLLDISETNLVLGGGAYYGISTGYYKVIDYYTKNNEISSYMFCNCKLSTIKIPNSVTSIGDYAFYGCSGLTSVTIPSRVTSIGSYAFRNCSGLATIVSEIENPFAIGNNVFYSYDKDIYATAKLIVPDGKKSAYESADGWNKFNTIFEVRGIGYAFEVDGIKYRVGQNNTLSVIPKTEKYSGFVVIPESVEYLGKTYSVTSIGDSAFLGCSNLASITIPEGVTSIGYSAFSGCSGLTSVTIPNSVTRIEEYAFSGCSNLESVTIGSGVTFIDVNAFKGCNSLKSVHITDLAAWCKIHCEYDGYNQCSNPLQIANHLYLNGVEIKDLVIPNTVALIGMYSFYGYRSLTSVTIGNSVTSIGWGAFCDCCSLTSVTIPNSVTSIGGGAFYNCSGLTSIVSLNSNPPSVQNTNAFYNVDKNNCIVWVPKGSLSAYKGADEWKNFANIWELAVGDLNLDEVVDQNDMDALVGFVMGEKPKGFYEGLADLNGDNKIDAADVVKMVDLIKASSGLSVDSQLDFDNSVVSSLTCTLNNERSEAILLTKCELYCNHNLVSYKNFSGASASVQAGGSKECTFNNLAKLNSSTGFTVCWHYTASGKNFVYRCPLKD